MVYSLVPAASWGTQCCPGEAEGLGVGWFSSELDALPTPHARPQNNSE